MKSPLISFVVVTFNSEDTIDACLDSIKRFTSVPFEVIIVDNSPNEQTANVVRQFIASQSSDNFILDYARENLGFAKGCNRGASRAKGEYLLFINPDTELMGDAVAELLECRKQNPGAAAIGPAIMDAAGNITPTCRNLPTTWRMVLDATGLDKWLGAYRLTRFSHREPRRVEQIMGSAMLIPLVLYREVGGMDERFFIYYEEVDLCKRLAEANGEVWFWPSAVVKHLAGISTEAAPVRARMIYILRESRKKYFYKHFGTSGEVLIDLIDRSEGIGKWAILRLLSLIRNSAADREKARGFLSVARGVAPQG